MIELQELSPRWVTESKSRWGMGLSLVCPLCRLERLVVWFKNPLDGGPSIIGKEFLWDREGETFDTLSLKPSIDATWPGAIPCTNPPEPNRFWGSHWHGCITDGKAL